MTRLLLVCVGLVAGCVQAQATARSGAAQPDILLIIADDAGYADFGFMGSPGMPTPHLDALARRGMVFTQGYVTSAVCSPSRAGLLTGRHQQRFGHHNNLGATGGLPQDEVTMADHLRAAGYHTAAIGKWHLGYSEGYRPTDRGFDTFIGLLGGSRSYWPQAEPSEAHTLWNGMEPIEESFEYFTPWLGEQAVSVVEARTRADGEQPLFMYLSYTAPHSPLHAPEALRARYGHASTPGRQTYLAMMESMDRSIGEVLAAFEARGRETIVLFISDNGGATDNQSDNGILRGMKGTAWEGGVRVPMVVSWPGVTPAFSTYGHPVSTLDFLPTLLGAAGASPIEGSAPLDGVDLRTRLTGADLTPPHETMYWKRSSVEAVRHGDWKLIRLDTGYRVLVNLATDPGETVNQLDAHPEVAEALAAMLDAWVAEETVEPLWREGDYWEEYVRLKHAFELRGREAERARP